MWKALYKKAKFASFIFDETLILPLIYKASIGNEGNSLQDQEDFAKIMNWIITQGVYVKDLD